MTQNIIPSAALALFAGFSLVLGAALPTLPILQRQLFAHRLSLLVGFSAGLMLATALHDLLPAAMELNHKYGVWGASLSFLGLYAAERLTHFHTCRHRRCEVDPDDEGELSADAIAISAAFPGHDSHHGHDHEHHHFHGPAQHADTMALVGMGLHNLTDGLALAASFAISPRVGVMVVLAIVLHQLAAGLSMGAIMLRAGRNSRRIFLSTAGIAACILLGALLYCLAIPLSPAIQGIILGISGGSFLYVAACDLLPEAHAEDEGWSITASTVLGYIFVLLSQSVFPHRA